ncbi:MAG: nitroreductase [Firmicutes bacterium HGW-Firmicutes-21]|nr:MAG: nitroreductase [Firmicutes bacterium HGW-Firmicutes-21]
MRELYDYIFKRRSVRKYYKELCLSDKDLDEIKQDIEKLIPLDSGIKTAYEIVKREETTAKFGEYCLILYSENKPFYLFNAGYLLEQMDLLLASRDIGACWYGMAKPKTKRTDGLEYVIMLAFGKSNSQGFRSNVSQFNRKEQAEIWEGEFFRDICHAARLAPSACNTQPWRIASDSTGIKVYRKSDIKSFIPLMKLPYFNSIDMGIFLCFLEIALLEKGYSFDRQLKMQENNPIGSRLIEIAEYSIK